MRMLRGALRGMGMGIVGLSMFGIWSKECWMREEKKVRENSWANRGEKSWITYTSCGIEEIDSLVQHLLENFVSEEADPQNLELVILNDEKEPDRQGAQRKDPELFILKGDDFQPVNFLDHLSALDLDSIYTELRKKLYEFEEFSLPSYHRLLKSIEPHLNLHLFIIEDPSRPGLAKSILSNFHQRFSYASKNLKAFVIKDQFVRDLLGLKDCSPGELYLLAPINNNVLIPETLYPTTLIGDENFIVAPVKNLDLNACFASRPWLLDDEQLNPLIVRLTINENEEREVDHIRLLKEISVRFPNLPRILSSSNSVRRLSLSLERNNFEKILEMYQSDGQSSKLSDLEKEQLIYDSHVWNYNGKLVSAEIEKWISKILDNPKSIPQSYKTQKENPYESLQCQKLVGSNYARQIFSDPEMDKIVFHYSRNCGSCSRFGPIFNDIALKFENQTPRSKVKFFKINNELNKTKELPNFNSTPVFVYYKDAKHRFIYRNVYLNHKLLTDFIEITRDLKILDPSLLEAAVQRQRSFTVTEDRP